MTGEGGMVSPTQHQVEWCHQNGSIQDAARSKHSFQYSIQAHIGVPSAQNNNVMTVASTISNLHNSHKLSCTAVLLCICL